MTRFIMATSAAALVALGASPSRADSLFIVDSFFDVFTDLTQGPPYPSDPLIRIRTEADESGDPVPTEEITLNYTDANDPGLPMRLVASDSGGGPGLFGIDSFFDVFYDIDIAAQFPGSSTVAMRFGFEAPSTSNVPRDLIATPQVLFTDSFFDVFFDVTVTDVDNRADRQRHQLHGTAANGLRLRNVLITDAGPGVSDSFFDVFVEIDLPGLLLIDPAVEPVMSMQMNAQLIPEPATACVVIAGAFAAARCRPTRSRR
ncbi:MAG: hypothetical protein CMJ18_07910 [Phycisphaeraceae bacterium]|nr:hypothetical protein [Phycisphaeraceae bacterium]